MKLIPVLLHSTCDINLASLKLGVETREELIWLLIRETVDFPTEVAVLKNHLSKKKVYR